MFAAIVGYQTALLLDRGFSNGEAGLMTAVRCLAGIVCQPLLGGFADRHPGFPSSVSSPCPWLLSPGGERLVLARPGHGPGGDRPGVGGHRRAGGVLLSPDGRHGRSVHQRRVPIRYSLGRGIGSLAYAVACVLLGFQVGAAGGWRAPCSPTGAGDAGDPAGGHLPGLPGQGPAARGGGPKPQSALVPAAGNPRFTPDAGRWF